MNKYTLLAATVISLLFINNIAAAAVSAEEAGKLKSTLTPLGGERAGNKDGSIPPWDGGYKSAAKTEKRRDLLPGDKPLIQITAKNMGQYAGKLSAGVQALLTKYPTSFRVDVYATRRTVAAPQWVYDNTFKNATHAKTTADKLSVEGAYGGIPFPIPKDGYEAIWNHTLKVRPESVSFTFRNLVGSSDGHRTTASESHQDIQFPYYMKDGSSEKWDNGDYLIARQVMIAPPFKQGESLVIRDSLDVRAARRAWQYLVGQRRVRRAPTVGYDTPDFVASGANYFDEVAGFFGASDRYEWKLIGKKELYVPYNNDKFFAAKTEEAFSQHHLNPDKMRWELHRVWELEATVKSGKRHAVPKRTYYLDEDSWIVLLMDGYDASGNLWRTSQVLSFMLPEVPALWSESAVVYDLQAGTWSGIQMLNDFFSDFKVLPPRPDSYFTGDALGVESNR